MRFFRKKTRTEEAPPAVAAAPEALEEASPSQADGQADKPKPRRRRGTRGGRGRGKKKVEAAAQSGAKTESKGEAKTEPKPRQARQKKAKDGEEQKPRRRRTQTPKRSALPKVKKEILVSVEVMEQRVAVLEDDVAVEVYLGRPSHRSVAGNVYKGIVDNVLPGMEASFVDIGLEKNGFLYVDEIVVPELEGKQRHGRRIQELIERGQEVLVQAVKDPMGTKGARLTTEISLPGRFLVFVPYGDGIGVSRRLEDEERERLKAICKELELPDGGLIVRTAAEGASKEELEGDLALLQKLWSTIQGRAKRAEAPSLVYQESELPLRIIRDLFIRDFEKVVVDHDRTYRRIVGYLKRTSPELAARVEHYKGKEPLMERYGVDEAVRSTLNRRVDLPSGGYLIFDYAEAFTVVDVNTGRFVGSRGRSSGARLEDTITKNNLEAVSEVVRQLRLRDIGGIIVIDFIDMANPKNRQLVEEALERELERDRTKTYVVEISPLGLVEMTRQNVTDGPREILTNVCAACKGDGVIVSMETHAVDAERRIRRLIAGSKSKAFHIELNSQVASALIGPGAERLAELEKETGRTLAVKGRQRAAHDHFVVLEEGTPDKVEDEAAPVERGQELEVELEEAHQHSDTDAIARVDGYVVTVKDAASRVGETVPIRIENVTKTTARAVIAEGESENGGDPTEEKPKKKTRRGTRGGRGRKKKTTTTTTAEAVTETPAEEPSAEPGAESPSENGEEPKPKKKTRRGTRGGRGRKRKPVESPPEAGQESPLA
ncbi:MAG TPA: Rne/Rng family ribonuclease [Gaiellaceae bacterium]|nr:Rne/Rng family ribonuclease [Gaiellaceae bacterium]